MITKEISKKYAPSDGKFDGDTTMFLRHFDEPLSQLQILEIGSHDEPVANMLADTGHHVTGIDLRRYDVKLPPCNYTYIQADFNAYHHDNSFNTVIALSCLEHFGLNTYSEGSYHAYYDVIAAHKIWQVLKPNGTAYITVPYGSLFIDHKPHWRVYDHSALQDRLIQDFTVEKKIFFFADDAEVLKDDTWTLRKKLEIVSEAEADMMLCDSYVPAPDVEHTRWIPPHLTVFLKLRKVVVDRIVPH